MGVIATLNRTVIPVLMSSSQSMASVFLNVLKGLILSLSILRVSNATLSVQSVGALLVRSALNVLQSLIL